MIENALIFIEQNTQWAVPLIFLIAFIESIVLLGLFMPGWLLMVGVGTLIGADVLPFYPMLISAFLGAVIGEYISYLLGYHYHEKILLLPFVASHQSHIQYGRKFFEKHGVFGVFAARFFGPTRAFIPFLAGVSQMEHITFMWVNLVSAILWAPLYLAPGILVGSAIFMDKETSYSLIFVLVIIGFTFIFSIKYLKRLLISKRTEEVEHSEVIKLLLMLGSFILSTVLFMKLGYWGILQKILVVIFEKI